MKNLREIIEELLRKKPYPNRTELFNAVMVVVKRDGFYTDEELTAIEDELAERLRNY